MPSMERTGTPHCNRRWRNNEIGQPEKWTEGSLCVTRGQRRQLPMPSQSIRPALPPSLTSRRHRKDLLIVILGKGRQSRCHGQTYQPSIKIRRNGTPIPHQQGHPNKANQYTLPEKRRRQCPSTGGILQHTNPKNGPMAWGHVQGVH